jgi:peptidoglycan/xylan/chitin deacetylase (PgdA/CDA1 family)
MKYANLSTKKIAGMGFIVISLVLLISGTVTVWARAIGTFSLSSAELAIMNTFGSWSDRMEFNLQFGTKPAPGVDSLLAIIGITPPVASSQVTATETTAQSIPVLLYHGIVPAPSSTDPDETSIATFKAQMFALKNAGWQTVSIEDFVAAMQGKKMLPPKSFLLTFDDGRQDAYYNATPILQALGYQAVMYTITGHSLGPNNQKSKYYVTEDQLQQMLASGVWELQSHSNIGHAQYPIDANGTLGDFYGNELWIPAEQNGESSSSYATLTYSTLTDYFDSGKLYSLSPGQKETLPQYEMRIITDLTNAKDALQNDLGVNAISFAYPYNDFAEDLTTDNVNGTSGLIEIVDQIYQVSFYQWYPSLGFSENYPNVDGQLLKRIEPKPDWTPDYLLGVLAAGQPKPLPYALNTTSSQINSNDWVAAWGNVSQSTGALTLSASTTTSGAYTILDGSRLWDNYDYEMQLNWQTASSISLFGYYTANPENIDYVACNYGHGTVQLENHQNGTVTVLGRGNNPSIGPGDAENLGIRFVGNYAECLWKGGVIAGGKLPSSTPTSGGIGIEIWNTTPGTAAAVVTNINVQ